MLFIILLLTKILLFMNRTRVIYHRPWVFLLSFLIISFGFSLIYLTNLKRKGSLAFASYLLISFIMFADIMYFTYFNTLPSIIMLKLLGEAAAAKDSVKSIFSLANILFIIDIPFLIFYFRWKKKHKRERDTTLNKYIRWASPIILGSALVLSLFYLSKVQLFGPVTNQEFFTYHAKDIKKTFMDRGEMVGGVNVFSQDDFRELQERGKLIQGDYTGLGQGKNLLVIQVEALQNFVINRDYQGQEITPNLNKLVNGPGSLYFDNYYQLISRGNTSDAEFVSNNSLYPSADEPSYSQYGDNSFYGLPWILRDEGYRAWAFHGYDRDFWNRDQAYPNQGFERYIAQDDFDLVETIGLGITDGEFFKQSIDYLEELNNLDDNPFYSFMITLTSHNPFEMPEEYHFLDIEEKDQNTLLGNYLQAIHYADRELGNFFEDLREKGLYDNTVIALYGDHFGINAIDKANVEMMTDYLGYDYDLDEMMKIPLIVHVPGEEFNERISKVGSQLDFAPTILNLMGYENKKGIMLGRDLVNYQGRGLVAPQTYALKGSVITDEVLIAMSRDGIFENSRGFRLDTREPIRVADYREDHLRGIEEINKSNFILENDLLKGLLEGDGEINIQGIWQAKVALDKTIQMTDNTIEDLNKKLQAGYTSLGLELQLLGQELVFGDETPIEELVHWLDANEEVQIIAYARENNREIFTKIMEEYKGLGGRIIPVIDDLAQHYSLDLIKYKDIILQVDKDKYTEDEILDFLDRHQLLAIITEKGSLAREFTRKVKAKGTLVYNATAGTDQLVAN